MGKFLKFMDGKKRGIAAVGGVILTWCLKWHVMPEMYLELLMAVHGLFTTWAVADAVNKKYGAKKEPEAETGE